MFLSNVKFGMPTVIDVMPSVKYLMSNVFAESQIQQSKRKLCNVQYLMSYVKYVISNNLC